ncbi:MAG: hypothetical protein MUO34_02845 [Ignavibacteriaceae bacterium]|nr:hypothetical protein [Ignavibacteriaceae bacterium]
MEIFKLIVELVSAIIWPSVIILIFFKLRKNIVNAISNLEELVIGKFSAKLRTAENQSDSAKKSPPDILKGPKPISELEKLLHIFSKSTVTEVETFIKINLKLETEPLNADREKSLLYYSILLFISNKFNWIYPRIYGSQIKILLFLNTVQQAEIESVRRFYLEAQHKYLDFYKSYTFEEYLSFLKTNLLVVVDENTQVRITDFGKDFISFLVNTNLNLELAY